MRNLRRAPEGEAFVRLAEVSDNAASFHRGGCKALVDQACFDNDTPISRDFFKDFVDGIGWRMHAECNVGLKVFVEQRRIWLHGFLNVNYGRKGIVIDLDQVSCVACCVAVIRNDDSNRVTIETYFALSEWTVNTHTVGNMSQRNSNRNISDHPFEVLCCINSTNTRVVASSIGIDTVNASMSIGAPQD